MAGSSITGGLRFGAACGRDLAMSGMEEKTARVVAAFERVWDDAATLFCILFS